MDASRIRNFSIIAHIDHGKSTLADRMLEATQTIETRKMKAQVLDQMDLERERGITIKMQPVRMRYAHGEEEHVLNLIDTPGHIDFSYEVSRALKAVEGAVLLVDATQGVQAQTFTTLELARELGLVIIPAVNKVDSPLARVDEVKLELARLMDVDPESILETSGKTGQGVRELLERVIDVVPPPRAPESDGSLRALIFDFHYSNHRGIIVFVRIFNGRVVKADQLKFVVAGAAFNANDVGIFAPDMQSADALHEGEIGYIVTGVKEPGVASVGDTVVFARSRVEALPGYLEPKPVVWASVYPESQSVRAGGDDFAPLRQALLRLKLSDSSLSFEEEHSGTLGRGFRLGLLGMLHLEIVTERLRREFNLDLVVTTPSIIYEVTYSGGKRETIFTPHLFPNHGTTTEILEPWATLTVITPAEYVGTLTRLFYTHEAELKETIAFGDNRLKLSVDVPLRELMRNFFDEVKSATSGYASLSYELSGERRADVVRLDVLVAGEPVEAFARVVSRKRAQEEAEEVVERLHGLLPRQQFETKIQAQAFGRILSSKTLKAFRKDVTAKLYGGDVTRKMKLLEKQKKGKKKMRARGKIDIPHDVFMKMMRGG